jgi:hypothetical protein
MKDDEWEQNLWKILKIPDFINTMIVPGIKRENRLIYGIAASEEKHAQLY